MATTTAAAAADPSAPTTTTTRTASRRAMRTDAAAVLLLLAVPLAAAVAGARGLVLDGTYGQFRKWDAGVNGTLEMEFKTRAPNGLLMYTDDGGTYDFFELKMVEGTMRLRYNLGAGAQILMAGHDLYDGRWHHVAVERRGRVTALTVDNATSTAATAGKELRFGRLASNSAVYVGGMPGWYNGRLTRLALPSVIFEPRFSGAVRNVVYADDYYPYPRRQTTVVDPGRQPKCTGTRCRRTLNKDKKIKIAGGGINGHHRGAGGNSDACEKHDPCQHGGICISTDDGPKCQCRDKNFEGAYCEIDKIMAEASFTGEEFLKYAFNGNTEGDSFVLHFKTKQPAGLLYHMGDGSSNYLNVGIVTGGITVTMRVGTGSLDMFIKPNRIRFDDNQWHKISVTRKVQGISAVTSFCKLAVTVDEVYGEQGSSAGAFTSLPLGYLYLGGSENTVALPGTKASTNFVGCIRKVEYTSDGINKYDFLEMGKTGISTIQVYGRLQFSCQDFGMDDPVCLSTPRSFLMLPNWDGTTSGSISVKFRTNEPDGLLFFSRGQTEHTTGIYAVEMVDGRLYVYLDLGAGGIRAEVSSEKAKVNDGQWHEFSIWRNDRDIHCTVDDYSSDFTTNGDSNQLHLQNGIMLGFGGRAVYRKKAPPGVWTLSLETGFVGCVRDLVLDGVAINLVSLSLEQDHVSITPHCPESSNSCKSDTCYNGGICHEGWNRVICDCSNTEYAGATCMKESSMYSFNGTQYLQAIMPEKMTTQVENMYFRFKTNRPLAVLMKTFDSSWDRLEIALIVGKIRLALKIGDKEKVVLCGSHLDDNNWHSVHYIRRAHEIRLKVDNVTVKNDSDMEDKITLKWQGLLVGGSPPKDPDAMANLPSFIGSMQQFILNKINYFDLAKISTRGYSEDLPKVHMTSKYQKQEKPPSLVNTVTFLSKNTFIGLPPLKAYSRMEVYFRFKTKHTSGLFFYNGGKHNDFTLAELINGHVLINIRSGTHVIRLRDSSKNSYSDNYWHSVHLLQISATMFCLVIDDQVVSTTTMSRPHNIQLNGMFYVGGVPKELHQRQSKHIHSRHGFEGCMSGLEYNGESPDMVENATIPSTLITVGCDGLSKMCTLDMCDNHGTCVEQWNSYSCDCDMTAYVGPTCSEPSISYEFGPDGGLVTYAFPDGRQPDMQNDLLALGFITTRPSGVLFRVESGTSSDYLQLEMVNGHIVVIYNVGTNDHPIGEANIKVNDNSYHLVRFVRSGPNSTLQVDDNSMQTLYPSGHQLSVFNRQSTIQVGGRWNKTKQRIDDAFEGVMVGLVFNGLRVFDLTANRDPRTTSKGDAQQVSSILDRLNEHSLLDTMQQTPASGVMDDLVYSGAGSGCNHDDEDQCTVTFDTGSGDDLITPVYVPPTVVPPPSLITEVPGACDDEETDCITGSGFGPTSSTDDSAITTKKNARGRDSRRRRRQQDVVVRQPDDRGTRKRFGGRVQHPGPGWRQPHGRGLVAVGHDETGRGGDRDHGNWRWRLVADDRRRPRKVTERHGWHEHQLRRLDHQQHQHWQHHRWQQQQPDHNDDHDHNDDCGDHDHGSVDVLRHETGRRWWLRLRGRRRREPRWLRRARRRDHGDTTATRGVRRGQLSAGGQADATQARGAADQHEGGREHGVRGAGDGRHAHHHRAHHLARAQGQVQDRHQPVQDRDAQGVRRPARRGQGRAVPAATAAAAAAIVPPAAAAAATATQREPVVTGQLPAVQAAVAHVRADQQLPIARRRRGWQQQQGQEETGRQGMVRVSPPSATKPRRPPRRARLHLSTRL